MEEKRVKAGSVAVGICLLVIALLLVGTVIFVYNTSMEKNNLEAKVAELENTIEEKDKKVRELEDKISKVSDVINPNKKDSAVLKTGNYTVDEVKYDEAGVSNAECGITLKENNEFKIYMGWGTWYSGKYEIKENKLICKAVLNEWDGGPGAGNRKTDVIFTYKILDNNKVQLSSIEDNDSEYQNNFYEEALSIGMTYSIK